MPVYYFDINQNGTLQRTVELIASSVLEAYALVVNYANSSGFSGYNLTESTEQTYQYRKINNLYETISLNPNIPTQNTQQNSSANNVGILIRNGTATAVSEVAFTSVGSYRYYIVQIENLITSTGTDVGLQISTNNGSSYITTNYQSGSTQMILNSSSRTNGTDALYGLLYLSNMNTVSGRPTSMFKGVQHATQTVGGSISNVNNNLAYTSTANANAFRIFPVSGGTITLAYRLYGVE